jgi:WD40 repeat protein
MAGRTTPASSILAAALVLGLTCPDRSAGGERPAAGEVARLIRQLGSERFAQREAATRRLAELGEAAWEALRVVATGTNDPEVRRRARQLVEDLTPQLFGEVRCFEGHAGQVNNLALSGDGRRLLTGSLDKSLRLWDVATGREAGRFPEQPGGVWCVALSADGKQALSGAGMVQQGTEWVRGTDFALRLWNAAAGVELRGFSGHTDECRSLALSPDGRRLLSASLDASVRLWDLATGKEICCFRGHTVGVRQAVFSPDGRRVLSAGKDRTARLWEVDAGRQLRLFRAHTDEVFTVAFTPDGRQALSGGADGVARLWDTSSGEEILRLEGHQTVVWTVAVSPDGRRALTGGGCRPRGDGYYAPAGTDYAVRLWDLRTGREGYRYEGHQGPVMRVLFSPDGRYAFSGSSDGTVRQWRVPAPAD